MSVFSNNLLLGAGGQSTGPAPFDPTLIGNSVWLDGSADFLSKTFSSGSAQTRLVFATWVQRNSFTGTDQAIFSGLKNISGTNLVNRFVWHASDDMIEIHIEDVNAATIAYKTSRVFRDIGWYHLILSIDSNETDSVQLYVNGVRETTLALTSGSALSAAPAAWGNAGLHNIGAYNNGVSNSLFLNNYVAQATMLVGKSIQAGTVAVTDFLDAFTFGTNGSEFTPKSDADIAALASTAGGNSFCLDFADSADLGNDISSNANDFTTTSMSSANQSTSTPSKVYPTFNPLTQVGTSKGTFSEGNTKVSLASDNGAVITTTLPSSGMWYWEIDWSSGANGIYPGIALQSAIGNTASSPHTRSDTFVWLAGDSSGRAYNGSSLVSYVGSATSIGRIAVAFDADNTAMYFGTVSGSTITWLASGDPTSGSSKTGAAPFTLPTDETLYLYHSTGSASIAQYLFDEDDWTGVTNRPTDAKSLNSANLTAPEFQGIDYFAPTLYEGNGTGQRVGDFVPFTDAYTVDKSAMFNSADLRYLARTPSSGGNEKTLTFSTWIKMTGVGNSNENAVLTTDDGSKEAQIRITGTTLATKKVQANLYNGSSFVLNISTDRTFGDTSSWNHLVVAYDTRAAVASANKVIIYINGVRQSVSGTDLATDDYDTEFNSTNEHNIGRQTNNGVGEPDFYLAETVMIDGQQLDATSFGQLDTSTNRWVPKDVSGLTFGTNGFYLQYGSTFASGSGAGTDTSGNSNNWTESTDGGSAWATTDQFIDTPTKNFTTFDPGYSGGGSNVWSEGNTKVKGTDGSLSDSSTTTFGMTGKVVFQFQMNTVLSGYPQVGFITSQTGLSAINAASGSIELGTASVPGSFAYTDTGIFKIPAGTTSTTFSSVSSLQALDADDILRFEVDTDAGTVRVYFQDEGTGSFSEITGARVDSFSFDPSFGIRPAVSNFNNSIVTLQTGGQTTLASVTTDYKEINQENLDDTASKLTALAWIKNRDATDSHVLVDRVRGVGEVLHSNEAAAEATEPNTVQRFLQRGVQVGSDVQVNTATESYVLWQWLIGDSATTGTVNNDGSIPSTVIAADAGHFSVGTYTGQTAAGTVGHGLGGAAEMVIVWDKGAANSIAVYHVGAASDAETDYLLLNQTDAATDNATFWNDTAPTSSVFSVGTGNNTNGNGRPKSFLAFRSVPAVCKAGSYIGNGNAAGPYIDLGFKPSWVMIKKTSGTGSWHLYDTARSLINEVDDQLLADSSAAETTGSEELDILSDGFKIRTADAGVNTSAGTYIYLAMADIGGNGTLPPIYGR